MLFADYQSQTASGQEGRSHWVPGVLFRFRFSTLFFFMGKFFASKYLHPTALPVDEVVSMSASPSGQHVALCCKESVTVMMLRRQRGPSGEFSGGIPEADCRSTQVAGDLLRAHCLHVVQVKWTNSSKELIVMLTSDGVLRLFSVSQPSVPVSSISVSTGPGHFPHVLHLEQEEGVVAFAVWQDRALLLHERMDVQALALKQGAAPTPPLPIYPISEDNYSGSGCGLLLLETTPPVLVLANDSGQLYHCVYLYQSMEQVSWVGCFIPHHGRIELMWKMMFSMLVIPWVAKSVL